MLANQQVTVETLRAGYADKAILQPHTKNLLQAVLLNFCWQFGLEYLISEAFYSSKKESKQFLPEELARPVNLEIRLYAVRKVPVKVGKKTVLEMVR